MKVSTKELIKPHSGVAIELRKGQVLKVTDPEGEQVSEMLCYKLNDPDEWLCSGRSLDHSRSWQTTKGHILYSNRSKPMLSILEDTCGRHDFILAPCNQPMFEIFGNSDNEHQSCHENLLQSLMGWEIEPDEIHTTFKIFMNARFKHDGTIGIEKPLSKAGDYILFRAEMDLVVGLTACAAVQYNNGKLKPIVYEVLESEDGDSFF